MKSQQHRLGSCSRTKIASSVVLLSLGIACANANTFTVSNSNDTGPGSLRQAIIDNNNSSGGNVIVFDPAFFASIRQIGLSSGQLSISKNVTIAGPGAELLGLFASIGRVFDISGGAAANISGLLISGGKVTNDNAGGIRVFNSNLTLTNCYVRDNSAPGGSGGGLYGFGTSNLTIVGCTFYNNSAFAAAAIGCDGTLTLRNSTISGNTSSGTNSYGGGVVLSAGPNLIESATILNNHADGQGGGINISGGTTTIRNTIVGNNTGSTAPDVFGHVTSQGFNTITKLDANATGFGATGDVFPASVNLTPLQDNGGPTPTHLPFSGNSGNSFGLTADQRGFARPVGQPSSGSSGDGADRGAVEIGRTQSGTTLLVNSLAFTSGLCEEGNCTLPSAMSAGASVINFADSLRGGTIFVTSSLNVTKSVVLNGPNTGSPFSSDGLKLVNTLSVGKPMLSIANSVSAGVTLTLNNLGIFGSSGGTGVTAIGHDVTVTDCWFDGNGATNSTYGGISVTSGHLLVSDSLFTNNNAVYGGAIFDADGSTILTNCTFFSNHASGAGGAIYHYATGGQQSSLTIRNCTFEQNSGPAGNGGHIAEESAGAGSSGVVDVANTVFGHVTGDLLEQRALVGASAPTFTSRGHNISIDSAGGDSGTAPGGFLDGPGDLRNTDPKLDVAPAQNGGFLKTLALLAGSPAIDSGDDSFAPLSDARGFARVGVSDIGAFEFQYTPTPTPTPGPTATPTTLANISTRLPVQTGDNVLIGGFIVTGTQDKKVIIRALGPSVPVPGALADPILELYSGSTLLESNDNWVDSPNKQAIIDSTIPPTNNLESAIVRTLPANGSSYTAIVRGVNNGTGIGVVEAYDLDRTVDSKLANISTRGLVQTGDNVLIAGTIILGQAPQKVIIRAIAPSLPFPGVLADPTLQLLDGNGTILEENDNWVDSPNKQAIIDSTIPPTNNLESAIVRTLPANGAQYTAIVRGVNNSTGIAVVEVYALN